MWHKSNRIQHQQANLILKEIICDNNFMVLTNHLVILEITVLLGKKGLLQR
jgi:hypothetical protein